MGKEIDRLRHAIMTNYQQIQGICCEKRWKLQSMIIAAHIPRGVGLGGGGRGLKNMLEFIALAVLNDGRDPLRAPPHIQNRE